MNTINEPLASKCVETSNFPVHSREEQFTEGEEKRIRMVEKNCNNEKLLLYIFSGDLCNINLWYIYTISILKCLKLAHEVV